MKQPNEVMELHTEYVGGTEDYVDIMYVKEGVENPDLDHVFYVFCYRNVSFRVFDNIKDFATFLTTGIESDESKYFDTEDQVYNYLSTFDLNKG